MSLLKSNLSMVALLAWAMVGSQIAPADSTTGTNISDVRVFQALSPKGSYYIASPEVHIAFNLAQASDVTVEVGAHRSDGGGQLSGSLDFYMANPVHVQTLKLGHLEAGQHEAVWNGLNEKSQPVMADGHQGYFQLHNIWLSQKGVLPTMDQVVTHSPVNMFRFTVQAGDDQVGVNYRRAVDGVGAFYELTQGDLRSVGQDEKGNLIASNWASFYCSHLSPSGQEIGHYPDQNPGDDNVEPGYAFGDNHGHALIVNGRGIHRFMLDSGQRIDWAKSPASANAILTRKVGPETPEATVKSSPGLGFGFLAWTADAQGNIYVLRQIADLSKHPNWSDGSIPLADVQVFDNDGNYKKTIPLPKEAYWGTPGLSNLPQQLAVDKDGNLWVGSVVAYLIDSQTGAIKGKFKYGNNKVSVGADGSVYGWKSDTLDIYRLHADGTPFPFGPKAPGLKNGGEPLSLKGPDSPLSTAQQQEQPMAIFGKAKGDFYVVMGMGAAIQLVHFAADGSFLPEALPRIDLVPSRLANAFVEHEPAVFDFCVNNTSTTDQSLVLDWTLTDFFGQKTSGKSPFTAKALERQAVPVTISAPEYGFYHLEGSIENNPITVNTDLARVRYHDPKPAPDSPFAIVCDLNFSLGAMIGQKKDRGSSDDWKWREPAPGLILPDVPDWPQVGFTAHRKLAAKWGVLLAEDSNYGEPWTEGFDQNAIHDLSLYLTDWMGEVDNVNGVSIQQYQFWNEPNNYWSRAFPFWNEYYNTVNGDFWSINKARDKETRSIPDGDAGDFNILTVMAADGTGIYIDGLPCHYLTPPINEQPKLSPALGTSEMGTLGLPESTALNVKKLADLRDQLYPGKPIIDTEDGWWGSNGINQKAGADAIPRFYIPAIAAGLNELYWFYWGGISPGPPGGFTTPVNSDHPPESVPQPAFCSYATMTQELEGAEFVGKVDLQKEATQAYLFRRGDTAILPVWVMVGQTDVTVPVGADEVTVYDIMSRRSQVRATAGAIPLHLTDSIQYVEFPFNAWAQSIAKTQLDQQLADLKIDDLKSIPDEMKTAAGAALTDPVAMNRYFHLVKAARQAAFAGEWPARSSDGDTVKALRAAILSRESADGYLRVTRLPLSWAEQIVRVAAIQGGDLEQRLLSVANAVAQVTQPMLSAEKVSEPGVALNAFIGDTGEIEKIRAAKYNWGDAKWPFYEAQFRSLIPKKAGDTFEIELTGWNFYRHPVEIKMAPKLPQGWTATAIKSQDSYPLPAGKFARALYTVTIPSGTPAGTYPIDGETTFNGVTQPGIRAQKIQVQ